MTTVYSDRSTYLHGKECARSRWFEAEVPTPEGFGVVPKKTDPNLLVGIAFHEGVRHLLEGKGADEAVGQAMEVQGKILRDGGLEISSEEDAGGAGAYLAAEGLALSEALIRGYELCVLPQVLQRFKVISTEQEEVTELTIPELPHFSVIFGGRTDALLEEADSGDFYVLSLKTKKEWKAGDEKKNKYDTQGLSEMHAVERRLGRWQAFLESGMIQSIQPGASYQDIQGGEVIPSWFVNRFLEGELPDLMGVTMQFALKGAQEKCRQTGWRKHTSHLIRPWMKTLGSGKVEWAWKYGWDDALGGGHRLGKGWGRVNIWEAWTVKEWVEFLWEENVQELGPGSGVQQVFILPEDYMRNEDDRARRMRQIVWEEHRVEEGRGRLIQLQEASAPLEAFESELDRTFPMQSDYPNNCGYCPYEACCYGPKQYLLNPLSSGLFSGRVSNHPVEVEVRGRGKVRE